MGAEVKTGKGIFRAFERKVHSLVMPPRALPDLDHKELEARLLSLRRDQLDWFAYDCFFDEDFHTVLYYLPYALQDMAAMVSFYGDLALRVVGWVSVCNWELDRLGLLRDVVSCMVQVFWRWLDVYRVTTEADLARVAPCFRFACVIHGGEQRDKYLSRILQEQVPGPSAKPLGDWILCEWANTRGRPNWSAHLLDMCARARGAERVITMVEALYKGKYLAGILGDTTLVRSHYADAQKAWQQHDVPAWYVREVDSLVLHPRLDDDNE